MTSDRPFSVTPRWKLLMRDIGIDVDAVLRRAGLPGDLFAHDRMGLSTAEYFSLWSGLAEESGDPLLPLQIGRAISVEAFDPSIFAALCSPDLNTALQRLAHYKRLMCAMRLTVDVGPEQTSLELSWLDPRLTAPPVLILVELVFFVQLARIATREPVKPVAMFSPVVPEHHREFTQYLGAPIKRSDDLRIVFSAEDAARPFLTANSSMWEFFEKDLNQRLADLDQTATTEERVHSALLELLPSGNVSVAAVAKRLGTGARTLQRRLKAEGYSFQNVLDRTREALAKHYLKNSAMTGTEISFLLGYQDPNSFFRAFSSWTGTTPERARSSLTSLH